MRKIIFSLCVLLLGSSVFAKDASSDLLIDVDQILQLSPGDQLRALHIVEDLAIKLEQGGHLHGDAFRLLPQALLSEARAQQSGARPSEYSGSNTEASAQALAKFEQTKDRDQAKHALSLLIAEAQHYKDLHQPVPAALTEQFRRTSAKVMQLTSGDDQGVFKSLGMVFERLQSDTNTKSGGKILSSSAGLANEPKAKLKVEPARGSPSTPEIKKEKPEVAEAKGASDPATVLRTDGCVSSGFVLQKNASHRCPLVHNLQDTDLRAKSPFDAKLFSCEGDQVLCNPLLFGFYTPEQSCVRMSQVECWKRATPVCVPFTTQALTKSCREKASDKTRSNLLQWIAVDQHKLWNEFVKSLNETCAGKNLSKDVTSTCEVAKLQLAELTKSVTTSKKAEEAKGWK